MEMKEFRKLLYSVDRSYDDFVSLVISFVMIPGNKNKITCIRDFIVSNPQANSSDVLEYMIKELGMAETKEPPLFAQV